MNAPPLFSPEVAIAGIRDISAQWRAFMGIPAPDGAAVYRTMADYASAPADEAWVFRCVNLKAAFAQGVPLRVWVKDGPARIPAEEAGNAAAEDLQGLLDDVNPVSMNGSDLKAFTVAALSVWGETHWRKVRGRFGGPPQELWWLQSDHLTPNVGRVWIDSYDYRTANGEIENYRTRDVVAFRRINLKDPTRGLSPISAARYEVSVNRQAAEWNSATLGNWGVPPIAWVIPKEAEFSSQDKSLVQRALRALRGPRNQGKAPILPQGLEPKVLSLSPRDAEWIAARKVSRMTICAVMGVPLVLAGDDEKSSVYANLRDAERIFARYMISELDWVADGINGWLVPDFDPARPGRRTISVAFDYSAIEALQEPIADRKRIALQELERGARSRDEYRVEFGIGPSLPPEISQFVELQTLLPIAGGTGGTEPMPSAADERAVLADEGSDAMRHLYRQPAVRAYLAGGSIDPVATLLGVPASNELAVGLRRRYTAAQILDGVPAEGFGGLRTKEIAA